MGSKWEKVKLCEIGKIVTGKTPPTKKTENFGNVYPFITPRDIYDQKYIRNTERCLSRKGFNTLKNKVIPPNSICVSCIGSDMGKVVMSSRISITNQQINSVIPNKEYNPSFIYYCLKPKKDYFKSIAGGTTMPILNKTDFSNIEINLPPLPEQQKIASILSAFDDKIELNNEMNKTLEEIAQAVFKHWFIDFEFPNENGEPYKSSGGEFEDSELGPIPKGWKVKSLDEIADFLNGLAMQKYRPKNEKEYLPVLKIKELRQGETSQNSDKCTNKIKQRYIVNDGDIIFSWSGSLLVKIWCGGKAGLNQHLFKVTSNSYPKWFYYRWIKHYLDNFRRIAEDKATTMGHIKREHLKHAKVIVPNEEELNVFDKVFDSLIEKYISNKQQIKTLSQLRDTLLPKLISGEIRVV